MTDTYELGLTDRDRVNSSFGGGLPAGSLVLVEGEHGAGKSVLTQRFCYGLCETGTHVTYVSAEETARGFIDQMRSMDYDPVSHLLREQMLFLHADVDTRDAIDEAEPVDRELLTGMMRANTMWRSDVVLVDGFDALLLHDPRFEAAYEQGDADDLMQNLISFFRKVVADGKTVVLTVNPSSLDETTLRPLRDVSDVYLQLNSESIGNEVRRQVLVRKFETMTDQVDDSIGFEVQAGRGFTVVTRTVA